MSPPADSIAALKAETGQEVGPCSRRTVSHPNEGDFHIRGCLLQKERRLGQYLETHWLMCGCIRVLT